VSEHRSGFACFLGRPNTGKSTLTNALVGEHVAITSDKPQTTRHAVRGILRRPDAELILVDTPGFHRPRTLLGERLNDLVVATVGDVDVVAFCVPADERVGPGDRFIVGQLLRVAPRTPRIAVVTKSDKAGRDAVAERLVEVAELAEWDEVVPVSAVAGDQVALLADLLVARLPVGPPLFAGVGTTDANPDVVVAELIREAALDGVHDELPHSIAVVVEEIRRRDDDSGLTDVEATMFVERESQKGIVIGTGGARLRDVGTRARPAIERLIGGPVYLDLRVKVAKDWQRDPRQLNRLGF
jgi:GTP-binding protein Era